VQLAGWQATANIARWDRIQHTKLALFL